MDDLSTSIPVGIHLATHTVQDGEASDYVLDVEGQIVQIGETIYLRYREPQEDNQDSCRKERAARKAVWRQGGQRQDAHKLRRAAEGVAWDENQGNKYFKRLKLWI